MLEIKDLSELDAPLRKVLIEMIEDLRHIEMCVEQEYGYTIRVEEIEDRDKIPIDEIWCYALEKDLSVEMRSLVTKWCVQKSRSGHNFIC